VTEAEFQEQVIELAHMLGWDHMHVRRSIGKGKKWTTATNVKGWPDLTLWHSRHGVIFVELKTDIGKTSPDQDEALASLRPAAPTFVWRPRDFDDIQAILTGRLDAAPHLRALPLSPQACKDSSLAAWGEAITKGEAG
jgi:hypothetical protein